MAPARRRTRAAARSATHDPAAAHTSNGDLVVDKEQAYLTVDPKQEVLEVKPDRPIPFPLVLSPYYVKTGPGSYELKDVEVTKVKLDLEEAKQARRALNLILQATYDLCLGGLPSSLDCERDITWDWRSVELLANAYGAFAYAVVKHPMLQLAIDGLMYDWIPIDDSRGIISVRKKCRFQSQVTRAVSDAITEAMYQNELLPLLVDQIGLEPQLRASVLTGTVEGVRMPCRGWRYIPRGKEGAWSDVYVHDFVLEVSMGDKTPKLMALAESYIRRGTLCVMTVKVERHEGLDIAWSYSLYRRGKASCFPERVTTYDMVCSAQDVRVKTGENYMVKFPEELTLFDFVPSDVLKKKGVMSQKDEKAVLHLSMDLETLGQTEARLGDPGERGTSLSEQSEMLEKLLFCK